MKDENDFFLKHMKGVAPIKNSNRAPTPSSTKNKHRESTTKHNKGVGLEEPTTTNLKAPHFSLAKVNIKKNIKKKHF